MSGLLLFVPVTFADADLVCYFLIREVSLQRKTNGLNLSWTALGGAALVMVLAGRDTHEVLKLVDWHLLLFFAALFVVVEGLSGTGLPDQLFQKAAPIFGKSAPVQVWNFASFSAVGSNMVSNVPFVLVAAKWVNNFGQSELMWMRYSCAQEYLNYQIREKRIDSCV